MAGFGLIGVEDRIPCPHCGSTDCAGAKSAFGERGSKHYREWLICIKTGKIVTEDQLWESVRKNNMIVVDKQ